MICSIDYSFIKNMITYKKTYFLNSIKKYCTRGENLTKRHDSTLLLLEVSVYNSHTL